MINRFLQFLTRSPTTFHAAKEVAHFLSSIGFTHLKEEEAWHLKKNQGYFITRNDSFVLAFSIPEKTPISSRIIATHLDSPGLKIKTKSDIHRFSCMQLNTEVYGSPILHSWLDRDLAIAGKIITLNHQQQLESHLVLLDECPMIIPQLALHLDKTVSEKGFFVHRQDHLKPIFSLTKESLHLDTLLRKKIPCEKIVSSDLFLTPLEKPALLGTSQDLIASHKLDNLASAFAAMEALESVNPQTDSLSLAVFFDHEEIGSMTYTGADSVLTEDILRRICISLGMDLETYYRLKAKSLVISGDLAHGLHPNFIEKYDLDNAPLLGQGVVIKYNANQKYANSSNTTATILQIAQNKGIPIQSFHARSDMATGSTVGSIVAARLGIPTIDLGIGSLAMHSIRETIATKDLLSFCTLLKEVFR